MIVNHETGHWFGLGHPCENNVWPLPSERDVLAKMLGLPRLT
jgi:predicted Zn-dependent protease